MNLAVRRSLGALIAAVIVSGQAAQDLTLYVSPAGNDRWSGRQKTADAQGEDGPLATVQAALEKVRAARAASGAEIGTATVLLRGGTYWLTAPLSIGPADSGTDAAHPLAIAADEGETPVLSGGRRVDGWEPAPGQSNLWRASVPFVKESGPFRQLFVNGERRQRARTPNEGYFRIQGASPQDRPVRLKYRAGDIKPEWAKDGDVEVVAFLAWADFRLQIRAVDEDNHVATLAGDPAQSNKESDAQYYIENAPDALDEPGEWYLNRRAGVVSYWPLPGEDMTKAEVIVPRLTELLKIEGDFAAKRPVQNVVLRGLTLAHTDWSLGERGYTDVQAAFAIPGHVRCAAARACTIERCTLEFLGGYALELGRGCQEMTIAHNTIKSIGAGGIRIGEPGARADAFERNHGHRLVDNHIHDLGVVYKPAVGVLVLQSGQNEISHNHIHDLYYTAISVGWNWGYQETPCRENKIEYNHMHDIGKGLLSDMGAIYTLGIQKGTTIRNNLIHDVNAFTYGGWGIYPDEGSTDITIESNIVYRTKSAGFHQHYGRDNRVRNNIFAFGKEHQLMRTRAEAHRSFQFERNIVYFDSGDLLGSNWSQDRYDMDYNLYFDTRLGANPAAMKFSGATWEQWRDRGHDRHSRVADPLFKDAAKYDFRLAPESPALSLGFQPINVSRVGVRE